MLVRFSRTHLWIVQELMALESGRVGLRAEIVPIGRELAEKLLEALWQAERANLGEIEVDLDPEEALRLAVWLKGSFRDERGLPIRPLIIDLLDAVFKVPGPDWGDWSGQLR